MREMKDSGIEWIGQIPSNWKIERMQWHLEEKNVGNNPVQTTNILSLTNKRGVIPYEEKGNQGNKSKEDVSGYKLAYPNTIVANSMNVIIGSVGLSKYYGCVSPVYYVFQATNNANIEFFNYIFSVVGFQRELRKYANGILEIRLRVSADNILKRPVAIPPDEEQARIVNFLNTKCSEIDAISADIQKEIEILEQYKRSVITEAVTKGLNPDAEMKDSGVPWIGKMPANWTCIKGKYILKYMQKPVKTDDGVITCFRDGEVTLRSNRREDGFTMADKEIGYQGIDAGDLVVHGMDGFAGAIGISDSRGKASPVLNVLDSRQNKKYIMYYLRSMAYGDVFAALATGIRVRSCDLRWNKLSVLLYPVPPLEEQAEIVQYIEDTLNKVNGVISEKKQQLTVIDSYKKSLIYEYVTGKKEVPNEQ